MKNLLGYCLAIIAVMVMILSFFPSETETYSDDIPHYPGGGQTQVVSELAEC